MILHRKLDLLIVNGVYVHKSRRIDDTLQDSRCRFFYDIGGEGSRISGLEKGRACSKLVDSSLFSKVHYVASAV